jgi:voltage-dependent potassium channel beta subunit
VRYRKMGSWGVRISAVSLGGWTTFGGSVRDGRAIKDILARASAGGINFFDMADVYAGGEAEREMGRALSDRSRHTLVLSSKVFFPFSRDPNDKGLSRKHIHESARASLKRIGTDYLDLYFAHRFDPEVRLDEVVRAFSDLVQQGLVLYWGTSEWPAERVREAIRLAERHGWHPPAVEQPEYSLIARRRVEATLFPVTREAGLGVVAWSPLGQGVLTGKYDSGIPAGSRLERLPQFTGQRATAENLERARRMRDVAEELGLTRAQLALAWALSHPEVTSAITGATRPEHVEENVAAADMDLPSEARKALDRLFPAELPAP